MTFLCAVVMSVSLQPTSNYQPDLCADGVFYNPRGATMSVEPGTSEPFFFNVANAGAKTDTIKLKATMFEGGKPDAKVSPQAAKVIGNVELRWFKGTKDVTNKVMAGKLKFRKMPSGAVRPNPPLRAEITAQSDATVDDNVVVVLTARSGHKPTRQDLVSLNVRFDEALP